MATILAKDVVAEVAGLLQDNNAASRRWPDADLLLYLNDGQRETVMLQPSANPVNEAVKLVAGTKQTLPDGAISLIKVTRNMGTAGTVPGKVITACSQQDMDYADPDWHSATADAVVQNSMYDENDPLTWYCSPPQPAVTQGYVELIYSATPADATINGVSGGGSDSTISLDDVYKNALVSYMLYRAYSKQTDATYNPARADASYQAFIRSLGLKAQSQQGSA